MMAKLDDFRSSKWGTALFFGYAVAIAITLYLVGFSLLTLHSQDVRLKAQATRSCAAIKGAAAFWRSERETVHFLLTDPTLTPILREGLAHYSLTLDGVITTADRLPCPRKELHG